jgi:hypothetical protein
MSAGAQAAPADIDAMTPEQLGRLDVYVVMRHFMKNAQAGQVNADGLATVMIKQAMAALMYPVDMGSTNGPDRDPKFKDQIKGLQKRMDAPQTGVLLQSQFDRLLAAAKTVQGHRAFPPVGKVVIQTTPGRFVAKGTWVTEDDAFPVNYSDIICEREAQSCTMTTIDIVQPNQINSDPDFNVMLSTEKYAIATWNGDELTAVSESTCRRQRLIVNSSSKQASLLATDKDDAGCRLPNGVQIPPLGKPRVSSLGDPFQEAKKFYDDQRKQAQKLMYENALGAIGMRP